MMPPAVDRGIAHVRAAADEAVMAARLARDLPAWVRTPISCEEAVERVRRRLVTRELRFSVLIERTIYCNPRSPYLKLLRHAGCELGDFQALVAREGVEGTLRTLGDRGVYVTFDELKGRREAVRGSARFRFSDRDFDNPLVRPHFVVYTGGTRGQPGAVMRSLAFLEEVATSIGATLVAHAATDPRPVFWTANPSSTLLTQTKLGQQSAGWLLPAGALPTKARLAAGGLRLLGRRGGRRLPRPVPLDGQRADLMAVWLDRRLNTGRPLLVFTVASAAVRTAIAAQAAGIDLRGVVFYLQSEPVTETRYQQIQASGARAIVAYGVIEVSTIAHACATPRTADDLHLFADRFALVERERQIADGGVWVNALSLTTLSAHAPKVCLNTELGDYAHVEQRACDCPHGALGLITHLSEVRSFEKLSAEGVTFVRSNLMQILEEVLPTRFGGTSLDYQLVEEEGAGGATRLVLRVNPSVGAVDQVAVRAEFLAELARGGTIVDRHHAELLRRAGSVVISRQPPLATAAGKVLPFHLLRSAPADVTGVRRW